MKDILKRIAIVGAIVIVVCLVFVYVKSYVDENNEEASTSTISTTETETENVVEEEVQSETDVVETYESEIARATTNVNFRTEPTTEGNVILTISSGSTFSVLSKIRNGWYEISYNDVSGYVSGEYIEFLTDDEKAQITVDIDYTSVSTYAKVNTTSSLNIRESATTDATSLTSVKAR